MEMLYGIRYDAEKSLAELAKKVSDKTLTDVLKFMYSVAEDRDVEYVISGGYDDNWRRRDKENYDHEMVSCIEHGELAFWMKANNEVLFPGQDIDDWSTWSPYDPKIAPSHYEKFLIGVEKAKNEFESMK